MTGGGSAIFALLGSIPILALLGALAMWDIQTRRLPLVLLGMLTLLSVVYVWVASRFGIALFPTLVPRSNLYAHSAVGLGVGFGAPTLIDALYRALRKTSGFGGGDTKLLGSLGILFGANIAGVFLLASIVGVAWGVISILVDRVRTAVHSYATQGTARPQRHPLRSHTIAFGPSIVVAATVVALVVR